jgi:hypothetical protein
MLVDDMRRGYKDGFAVKDHSLAPDSPNYLFRMRCLVLLWCGDYQGQGKIANMKHSGTQACHWCMHSFLKGLGTSGSCYADNNRRYTPPDSPFRRDPLYGADHTSTSNNIPPPTRTAADVWRVGKHLLRQEGTTVSRKRLRDSTGVDGVCILHLLPLFCIIMDICLDMMHVIKNIWQEHLLKIFKGIGAPKMPKTPAFKTTTGRPMRGEDLAAAREQHQDRLALYREVVGV